MNFFIPRKIKEKRCHGCGCALENPYHGESKKGSNKWRYWCRPCSDRNWVTSIESNPFLLNKYISIHGKKPIEMI